MTVKQILNLKSEIGKAKADVVEIENCSTLRELLKKAGCTVEYDCTSEYKDFVKNENGEIVGYEDRILVWDGNCGGCENNNSYSSGFNCAGCEELGRYKEKSIFVIDYDIYQNRIRDIERRRWTKFGRGIISESELKFEAKYNQEDKQED